MDTGATSYMISTGTLLTYYNSHNHNNIIVGNGKTIPIHGLGHTWLPYPLPTYL